MCSYWASFLMGTKHLVPTNSSCPIKPCPSPHSFVLSCAIANLVYTPSPMQTMHLPLVAPPILRIHTPPISSPYKPLALCVNVRLQPHTFPNPLDHTHVGPFPPSTLPAPQVAHDQTPQPTLISSMCLQFPPQVSCPTCWCQFISRGLACHWCSCQTSNSFNINSHDHPNLILSFIPTLPTLA
jgi:hypothetical protein